LQELGCFQVQMMISIITSIILQSPTYFWSLFLEKKIFGDPIGYSPNTIFKKVWYKNTTVNCIFGLHAQKN
jgi:hypothetical protein